MKPKNNGQLSLFDAIAEEAPASQQTPVIATAPVIQIKPLKPEWDEPFGLPIDLIGQEYLGGFVFTLSLLEKEAPIYTTPVFRVLLSALVNLRHQKKSWSQKSFTVFYGEIVRYDAFYLGFGLGNSTVGGELLMFLRERLQKIPAFKEFDSGSSEDFIPIFRYDKGFIVEYSDPELAGTSFFDGDDNYCSNQTIYWRGWQPADMHGLTKSRYSKLKTS